MTEIEVAPTSLEALRRACALEYSDMANRVGGGCTAEEMERYLLGRSFPAAEVRQRIEQAFGIQLQTDLGTWRRAAGLSLDNFAELVGCSAETLGRLECGEWYGPEAPELLSWIATVSDDAICPFACHQVRTRYLRDRGPVVIADMAVT